MTRAEYEQHFYNQQTAISNPGGVPSPVVQIQEAVLSKIGKTIARQPAVEQPDYSNVQVGTMATHESFGKGTITKPVSTRMTVKFKEGTKKFMFPSAFIQGFLTL